MPSASDPAAVTDRSPMADMNDLAKQIRRLRTNEGLTQRQLAEQSGLSPAYIGHLESGTRENPSVEGLEALAAALHADLIVRLEARPRIGVPPTSLPPVDRLAVLVRFTSIIGRLPDHIVAAVVEDLAAWEKKYPPEDGQ